MARNLSGLRLWIALFALLAAGLVYSETKSQDVSALNTMYTSLNSPSKLSGWKSSGGDPCGDSWKGIKCSGSSVTEIDLSDLGLSGSMGYQLASLTSVKYFDLSNNNLKNDIPYQLPPNVAHLDLSENEFTGSVPYSISGMTTLKYLNIAHNKLNNPLGDMFGKLSKLKELDVSYNSLSGDLPQSFKSLLGLTKLHLQNNKFGGSINVLANLPLDDLNVKNNKFTGWIPEQLKGIKNLETGGNSWSSGPAPPPPPGTPSTSTKQTNKKQTKSSVVSGVTIAGIALGVLAAIGIIIAVFSRRSTSPSSHFLDEEKSEESRSFTPLVPEPTKDFHADSGKDDKDKEIKPADSSVAFNINTLKKSTSISTRSTVSDHPRPSFNDELTSRMNSRRSTSTPATPFSLEKLQTATGNFAQGRLLGQGSVGCVYRAKYADGKVLAVKKIDSSLLRSGQQEEFSGIVSKISKLHHPNIAELVGYCSEEGNNILLYEYFRNGSLYEFLHLSDEFSKPLTWNTRVRIALGTARAVEYLHETCSLSLVHKNIKSSNILLDTELNPHLSDCGLASLHQCTSQNLGAGYSAPECTNPSAYTVKSDIYSFGIVMLELLTGRMPLNSSKPKPEQCLVQWATPQLHDFDALAKMVDPALRGLYPPKSLSRFADIIALCVQVEPEFRPPMSEVVEALVRLVQHSSIQMREDLASSRRMDDYDY